MFGDKYFAPVYFGNRYFATALGFPAHLLVTDLDRIQLPVNCVLAGDVPFKDRWREWDVPAARTKEKVMASSTPARRLKGPGPSFTTRTSSRGYD